MLASGRGVLGVYCLLENIIHYYYCQSERGGRFPPPPVATSKKCVEKSNPSESKRKEKLNGACFSCIAHASREL